MFHLESDLPPEQSIALAIDTANQQRAEELIGLAQAAGGVVIKQGLELMTAVGIKTCAELAADYHMAWIADAKLHDIPNTIAGTMRSYLNLDYPPIGITIHTKSGVKSMQAAQAVADEDNIMMLGVTHLTSIDEAETKQYEKATPRIVVWRETQRALAGNIGGLVCSGQEVGRVKRARKSGSLFTMVPGTRSFGAATGDQKRVVTPYEAAENYADLLVIGREVTAATHPDSAYTDIATQVYEGRKARQRRRF